MSELLPNTTGRDRRSGVRSSVVGVI